MGVYLLEMADSSNGYETIASIFIQGRGQAVNGIGASTVRAWARTLKPRSTALDLGCGTGIPMTKILIEAGLEVYAVDASPSMVAAFSRNFPDVPVACEAAEDSAFFHRTFDIIFSWGLMFLLTQDVQRKLIAKMAAALRPGGRLLFTAPRQVVEWDDAMTEQRSRSLGAEVYKELLMEAGLSPLEEMGDEGENHYFHAARTSPTLRL
jgi:SAM-dependent methyltransferase